MDPKCEFLPSFTQWLSLLTNVRLTYKHLKRALRVGIDVHLTSVLCAVHNRHLFLLLIFSSKLIKNMIVFGRRQSYVNGSSEWVKHRPNRFVNELQSKLYGRAFAWGRTHEKKRKQNSLSRFLTNRNTSFMRS